MVKNNFSLERLQKDYPGFIFKSARVFCWSAEKKTINYNPDLLDKKAGLFQLLHELGHGISGHQTFDTGIELLRIELEAWDRAKQIGKHYGITIDQAHIERCLDTYRDWLHLRSVCPNCSFVSTETAATTYRCFNCSTSWSVPADQRKRCYRLRIDSKP